MFLHSPIPYHKWAPSMQTLFKPRICCLSLRSLLLPFPGMGGSPRSAWCQTLSHSFHPPLWLCLAQSSSWSESCDMRDSYAKVAAAWGANPLQGYFLKNKIQGNGRLNWLTEAPWHAARRRPPWSSWYGRKLFSCYQRWHWLYWWAWSSIHCGSQHKRHM